MRTLIYLRIFILAIIAMYSSLFFMIIWAQKMEKIKKHLKRQRLLKSLSEENLSKKRQEMIQNKRINDAKKYGSDFNRRLKHICRPGIIMRRRGTRLYISMKRKIKTRDSRKFTFQKQINA
jgi:hypothetical protein